MKLALGIILPVALWCAAPAFAQTTTTHAATASHADRVAQAPMEGHDAALEADESDLMAQLAGDLPDGDGAGPELAAGGADVHGGMEGMGMHGRRGPDGPMGGMGRARRDGPGAMRGRWNLMAARLKLTDAQRDRIHGIFEAQERRGIQERADLQLAMLDLRHLMHADDPNAGAIDAQVDKAARLHATLTKQRIASLLEARAVLTPEQRDELKRGPMGDGRRGGRDGDDSDDAPRDDGR